MRVDSFFSSFEQSISITLIKIYNFSITNFNESPSVFTLRVWDNSQKVQKNSSNKVPKCKEQECNVYLVLSNTSL